MTDIWQEDPDFFRLTDEAWMAHVRKTLQGYDTNTDSRPPVASTPGDKGIPVAQPRVERQRANESLEPLLQSLEFQPGCECKGCDQPASSFIVWHPVHRCNHPVYEARLLHRLVCGHHLSLYEQCAERIARHLNPPRWVSFFRDIKPACSSCGQAIMHPGDVLQVVRSIGDAA